MLQVEDIGPGIAAAEREQVFQPFYRALGTKVDGSGLGLAIVREIARQHGAEVTLEDAEPRPSGAARGDAPGHARRALHRALPVAPAAAAAAADTAAGPP